MSRAARHAAGAGGRRAALVLALAGVGLAGCGPGPADPAATPPTFTVGELTFQVVSGGVTRSGGQLLVWITDQPDSCAAVAAIPHRAVYLAFTVAPPAAAPLAATVVASTAGPAAGQATGSLRLRVDGAVTGAIATAADGTLAWTGGATGGLTLDALDVGFGGTPGRVALAGLRLAACN